MDTVAIFTLSGILAVFAYISARHHKESMTMQNMIMDRLDHILMHIKQKKD